METLMVIPGAAAQIPLIKKLKEFGFSVVCVNPFKNSPSFEYADYKEEYDILDIEACIKIAKKYKVKAVISDECDIAMPTVAAVSEKLNLPSIGSDMASLYTNKLKMRIFSENNSLPCPKFRKSQTLKEAIDFFNSLKNQKIIIKPLDSNSSRGVFTIQSIEELKKRFNESLNYSRIEKAILCEEYIEGKEFTIDGIVINGVHHSLAISEKKHYAHNPNIACELFFSHENENYDYKKLREINDNYVNQSGLPFGFTHAEYKFNGKEFILIEIGARGGGNYISSHIVPIMTGLDNYQILLNQTFGNREINKLKLDDIYKNRCCVLKFFDLPNGSDGKILKEITNESFLSNNSNVLLHNFNILPGDIVYSATDDSKRIGFYIAYANTKEELIAFMRLVEKNIKFIF